MTASRVMGFAILMFFLLLMPKAARSLESPQKVIQDAAEQIRGILKGKPPKIRPKKKPKRKNSEKWSTTS